MARSVWKLNFFSKSMWRKIFVLKKTKKIKKRIIYDRNSSVPFCFKNILVGVHKGWGFRKLKINKLMVGYKFGEFSFTRKPFHFPIKKKKSSLIRR